MRLCFLAPANSAHTQKWIDHFKQRECEIHLVSFHFAEIQGVHLHHLAAPFKSFYLLHIPRMKLLLKKIKPDILHAHYASSYGFVGAALGFHPFVVSVWGSDIIEFPKRSLVHRKMLQYSLSQADKITVTSRLLEEAAEGLAPVKQKITRTPFGVDLERFKPESKPGRKDQIILGLIKNLDRKYGIEYLLKGFALVEKSYKNIRLVIAGDGPLKDQLRELAFQLGCQEKVEFLGRIPHSQVPTLLNEMDIFIMPSIHESFGVAALEASACGLPVIASDVGGIPEVVVHRKTGLLIPPGNPEALAEAVVYLIENPDLREKLGKDGREFVMETFDWQENAQRMENLYQELLSQN